ncbi:MAG: type II toxin-antitoxin system VapC family toxin [Solirubrobacterales bacterium]
MREVTLDASVVVKWFRSIDEECLAQAAQLRSDFEGGALHVTAPSLLYLEILNAAGRRWGWSERQLSDLADAISDLDFEILTPDPQSLAPWIAVGLTAYDATYVAVAASSGAELITADREILAVAGDLATDLADEEMRQAADSEE